MLATIKKYFWTANFLVLGVIAWAGADLLTTFVHVKLDNPVFAAVPKVSSQDHDNSSKARNINYFEPIKQRNIFDSRGNLLSQDDMELRELEINDGLETSDGPCVATAMAVDLLGTVVSANPQQSSATLFERQGAGSKLYKIGDKVLGKAKLVHISRLYVEVSNNGKRECIGLSEDSPSQVASKKSSSGKNSNKKAGGGVEKKSDNRYVISQDEVDNALSNLARLSTQIRFVPELDATGKSVGFKAFAIQANSLFAKIGLQNGDVVQEVNGLNIASPDQALRAFQMFRNEKNISLGLKRAGKKVGIDYQIK